jgi:hypothetical protein
VKRFIKKHKQKLAAVVAMIIVAAMLLGSIAMFFI